jgi:hypothetical protein
VPLVTISDVVFGVVSDIVGWCLLVTALGHLPAHLCEAVCGHPVVGGVLDGDVVRLLTVNGQCTWASQVGLAMSLGLIAPSLQQP